jgi:DNA-binding LytR/AlgR family response regulator
MIKAIAIDDEPLPLELLEEYCKRSGFISLERTFTQVGEAQKYLRKFPVDLLFLDIQMPKMTGLEFYKTIEQDTMVIFTTAYSQYAIEGFNLSAVDYLLKPYSYERFEEAAKKAQTYYNYVHKISTGEQFLYVRSNYSLIQIPIADILFIESFSDYLDIHRKNDKKVTVRMTMKGIMDKLPENDFMRVHRSFIVPIKGIEQIRRKTIYIAGREIPIGSNFEEEVFKRYKG